MSNPHSPTVINHIGVSGGKDSTALLLWAVHESGYPKESLDVTFCDTGNEHPITYDYIRMLSEKIHPIKWLKPKLDFYELAIHKKRFPSPMARFCTTELKMFPTRDHCFSLVDPVKNITVLLHSGVRAAESDERSKLPERGFDMFYALEVYRPLLRWTLDDVWAMLAKYNVPRNPLYDMGAQRVGCLPCIMSRKAEIRNIAARWPERIDMIRAAEEAVPSNAGYSGFFARDKVPLRFRTKEITTKAGEKMMVCTIDDVVRWSLTVKGAKGVAVDDVQACPSSLGACE